MQSYCWLAMLAGIAPSLLSQAPVDPALPARLKELRAMVAQPKMADDFRAVGLIGQLAQDPEQRNPADAERIAKALGEVFAIGKVRPPDKPHLYREAASALARFGTSGARELVRAATDARLKGREHAPVRAHMMTAIGLTKDTKQIGFLQQQVLRSPDNDVLAAAGEALGQFTGMEIKQRREVVKELVGRYGDLHMAATHPDPPDPNAPIDLGPQNARETLNKVEGKWTATLTILTGQNFTSQPEWQRWLNKNKEWTPPK